MQVGTCPASFLKEKAQFPDDINAHFVQLQKNISHIDMFICVRKVHVYLYLKLDVR